jgi:hypothetical protein
MFRCAQHDSSVSPRDQARLCSKPSHAAPASRPSSSSTASRCTPRIAAIGQGRIGAAHTAYLSVCHGYHGTSLIRHYLGLGFKEARIVGAPWQDRVLDPGGRDGPPAQPRVETLPQQLATLSFEGGTQALFDFVGAQYFSPIRSQRVAIRGERGEIVDHTLYAYTPEGDPLALPFHRHTAGPNGNLEGHHLKGIQLGESWVYRNPFPAARLSDEEIAMADLLARMGAYVRGAWAVCRRGGRDRDGPFGGGGYQGGDCAVMAGGSPCLWLCLWPRPPAICRVTPPRAGGWRAGAGRFRRRRG